MIEAAAGAHEAEEGVVDPSRRYDGFRRSRGQIKGDFDEVFVPLRIAREATGLLDYK